MKKTVMSRGEMLDRLEAGEDPLELSIEKWERNKIHPRDEWNIHGDTCALCEVYFDHDDVDLFCSECPLHENGMSCEEDESPYLKSRHYNDADYIIEALKSLRKE